MSHNYASYHLPGLNPLLGAPITNAELKVFKRSYLPYKLIADDIGIEESTVSSHMTKLMQKTGQRSKGELIYYGCKNGYIS